MAESASSTNITDPEAATSALAALAARAQEMGDRVAEITAEIARIEGARPWGPTKDYGLAFEHVYYAGGSGSEFVRENVGILADLTQDGARLAHQAVQGVAEVDEHGAHLFRSQSGDAIATRLQGINAAVDAAQNPAQ